MVPTYKGFTPGVLKDDVLTDRLEKAAVNFENGSVNFENDSVNFENGSATLAKHIS